ncbi:MAG: putative bifunctional diguanylate cyclase/phosphodiesterase [Chromatiales bacterium]
MRLDDHPNAPADPAGDGAAEQITRPLSVPTTAPLLRVLIIHDSMTDAGLLLRHLERSGYLIEHDVVDNPAAMRAALAEKRWDVIIAEYVLPQFDATSALEVLRESQQDIPFIVVASSIGADSAVRMLMGGARDYLLTENLTRLVPSIQRELRDAAERRERKRIDDQLRIYAHVFEGSCEAIIVADGRKAILSVNRAFTEITGYSAEEVIGQTSEILSSGGYDPTFYQSIWDAVNEHGYWIGEIWARRKSGELYMQWLSISAIRDDQGSVTRYVSQGVDITNQKRADERIHYLGHYDSLTKLPNRTLLHDRISRAIAAAERHGIQAGVMFIDLDRFKNINDSLGHPTGDRLLQAVAERLRGCVRDSDTVARLGGDEFVVVLPETGADGATQVAQKILTSLSGPYQIESYYLIITPSIGISIYPNDGQDIQTLIKNADAALYHAKDSGRNNYQFFTQEMNIAAFERISLENGLRVALERGEFELYYQPQIELASGRVTAVEALVRWNHPQWGIVPPALFIHVAEDSGIVVPLGKWMLRQACAQVAQWQRSGFPSVPVAVNISAVQMRHKDFSQFVQSVLEETGLPPHLLQLELTESILMQDEGRSSPSLYELSKMGVQLALDDFGTGYSSLTYLRRFPINKLKIDRSFIRNCEDITSDAAIVRAIINLAHSLGLKVIGEGVETEGQMKVLQAEGCDDVQGFYFSAPQPARELMGFFSVTDGEYAAPGPAHVGEAVDS